MQIQSTLLKKDNFHKSLIIRKSDAPTQGYFAAFPAGKVSCLLGASKSGKTHFLKSVCGLEKSNFEVYCEEDLTNLSVKEKNLSMLFASCSLFKFKTVEENIKYVLKIRGAEENAAAIVAAEAANIFDLESLCSLKAKKISSEEKFLVEIARAYARRPRAVLIDEPFLRVNSEFKEKTAQSMDKLSKVLNVPLIFSCSSAQDAFAFSEYIAVIDNGKILAADLAAALFKNPPDLLSAQSDGHFERSFFTVTKENGTVKFSGIELDFGDNMKINFDKAFLCASCEDIFLSESGFDCRISFVEKTEKGNLVYADFELSDATSAEAKFTFLCPLSVMLKIDDIVKVNFRTDNLMFFDCVSGLRLR